MTYWVIFVLASWLAVFLLLRFQGIKEYWPAALISTLVVYVVDIKGVELGAYRFEQAFLINGVPVIYLVTVAALGLIYMRFYPRGHWEQLVYIIFIAGLFLFVEYLMMKVGNFQHNNNWNLLDSYVLDLFGLMIISWLSTRVKVQEPLERRLRKRAKI
ncbi:CBO0543 family protein [Desulforamulus ruminis]|uniref:CBO0543 family protein n=1 Tax=Desulforamulus ruminis TaxID=1564 RepID=UPI0023540CCF|nr:CBO0543 family protein [Desulforamulus ruminis]